MGDVVAIILARGGSKGIPSKNIIDFCGKPLLDWTIEQLQNSNGIDSIWVSSDSEGILTIGRNHGAQTILRPDNISGDSATSESAWLHALEFIERKFVSVEVVIAPQVTSPLREPCDFEKGLQDFRSQECDSMFSCSVAEDLFFWKKLSNGLLKSENFDFRNRKRRQDIPKKYIENGSFYIFKPEILRRYKNRLGGKIGLTEMDFWKMFEIDSMEDLKMCEILMNGFLLDSRGKRVVGSS